MTNQIEISTERLILKSITPAIIHMFYGSKSKQEILDYFGFDEAMYEHYKNMHEKGMETHRISLFFFLMIDKETNLPIGDCGFHSWTQSHNRAELFYGLRNDSLKRKGFMKEAVQAVIDYGFNGLNLHRIEALVGEWNIPSVKLLLHYGFTKEGTMREDYVVDGKNENSDCYSLLKWEWNK